MCAFSPLMIVWRHRERAPMCKPGRKTSLQTDCDRPWSGTPNYRTVSRNFPYLSDSVCGSWVWLLKQSDTYCISFVSAISAIGLSSFTAEEMGGWNLTQATGVLHRIVQWVEYSCWLTGSFPCRSVVSYIAIPTHSFCYWKT